MTILAITLLVLALAVFTAGVLMDLTQTSHVALLGTATRAACFLTLASIAAALIAQP